MNAKYTVVAMLLASASAMAAPDIGNVNSVIEPSGVETSASIDPLERAVEAGSVTSVGERLERALEVQLLDEVSEEIPVIELLNQQEDIADAWPVPAGDKVARSS